MKTRRIFITGVSSGIGRALTRELISQGNFVWGVARRRKLLEELKKELGRPSSFKYSTMDISQEGAWKKLIRQMRKAHFIPEIVIFNAAVNLSDLTADFDSKLTQKILAINFFGTLEGVDNLLKLVKKGTQFIAISSSSALKGSSVEGVGYPASKAALSIAFESLRQKYRSLYEFRTIYFGPIASGMAPFKKRIPLVIPERRAVRIITEFLETKQPTLAEPKTLFFALKLIKLLPAEVYFKFLTFLEKFHRSKC